MRNLVGSPRNGADRHPRRLFHAWRPLTAGHPTGVPDTGPIWHKPAAQIRVPLPSPALLAETVATLQTAVSAGGRGDDEAREEFRI